MSEYHIVLSGVNKQYQGDHWAVTGIDLRVAPGEFVFLAGASGAGKSTLLKILFAEELASAGEVHVLGVPLSHVTPKDRALFRRKLGVIFQDYRLLPHRTVVDNVALRLEIEGVALKESRKLARELLSLLGLGKRLDVFPKALSGGEQQRVSIARALIGGPKLILADEPTGNLDPDMTDAVFRLLMEANRAGTTVVVASHNLRLIDEMNRRTVVLNRGRVIGDFAKTRGE